jgi:cold shock CspA family protein
MPTGRLKVYNPDRNFGFVTAENGQDIFFHADALDGEAASGAVVEYEVAEGENGEKQATSVTLVKEAPASNPVGRTMSPPPTWEELEERERQRRQARRRRR